MPHEAMAEVMENQSQLSDIRSHVDDRNHAKCATGGKYGLRPRTLTKRLQQEKLRHQEIPKKPLRSKSRPAPLSKYRRKTANARERHRMHEINNAFESLRKALPDGFEPRPQTNVTKITTLRHAVEYIQALSKVLQEENSTDSFYTPACSSHKNFFDPVQRANFSYDPKIALTSGSPNRSSLSSTSDLEELLSDESGLLDDRHDVFSDIPSLSGPDTFELLLNQERENMLFASDFCTLK